MCALRLCPSLVAGPCVVAGPCEVAERLRGRARLQRGKRFCFLYMRFCFLYAFLCVCVCVFLFFVCVFMHNCPRVRTILIAGTSTGAYTITDPDASVQLSCSISSTF